jgi:predicted pyridoxine 5'-phosphate oxidase superfamily flavin-nucleotide-binding protein
VIGKAVQELLESPCGLLVATAGADGEPHATRAWAADVVDPEAGRVRILIDADDAVALADLGETGALALTGADVRTLRSVQVKGAVALLEPATPADLERAGRHTDAFFAGISELDGIPVELLRRLTRRSLLACELTVSEVYDQTPGPGAGASLRVPRP